MRTPLIVNLADDAHKWGKPYPITRDVAFSIKDLCVWAGIECRAFGHYVEFNMIALVDGRDHFLIIEDDGPFYSVGRDSIVEENNEDISLRILEVMAYTFKEYASRECLNGQGLFVPPSNAYISTNLTSLSCISEKLSTAACDPGESSNDKVPNVWIDYLMNLALKNRAGKS